MVRPSGPLGVTGPDCSRPGTMAGVSEDVQPAPAPKPDDANRPAVLDLGFARLDVERKWRTGIPEVVYAEGKTPDQIVRCMAGLLDSGQTALATRVNEASAEAIALRWPDAEIDSVARCARVRAEGDGRAGAEGEAPRIGSVAVVSAGTSDASVSAEAAFVARALGATVSRIEDVGVAGLHRLMAVRDQLEAADVVIVVAGMDGALASAVGGLVSTPVVAVPTSVGYGAAFEGLAALLTMLNSCAPGVVVVNIDNGFGAATFAAKVLNQRQDMTTTHDAAFYASLPRKYVGAGVLITDGTGRVLMVQPTYKATWEVPGGVTEPAESAPAAARRECREELGLDIAVGRLLVVEHQTVAGRGDSIMCIYDGGVLSADAVLSLPAAELRSYRFIPPLELDDVTVPRLANRLQVALRARADGHLAELENGSAVPRSG